MNIVAHLHHTIATSLKFTFFSLIQQVLASFEVDFKETELNHRFGSIGVIEYRIEQTFL